MTAVDWLRAAAIRSPDRTAFVDLDGEARQVRSLTWGEVDRGARLVAGFLRERVEPGDRVVLAFAAGAAFAQALFGCFYAGVIAVPCAPPLRARAGGRALGTLTDCATGLLLTTEDMRDAVARSLAQMDDAPDCIALETVLSAESATVAPLHTPKPDDVALLQYTSGSTSRARGVTITHGNIVANLTMLLDWSDAGPESNFLSWLPLFHDMGLVVGYLMPLASGGTSHLITPATFAKKPSVWLAAASRFRATHSAAPNFAFDLCARQVPEAETAGLDLSSLHWVLNAAETIRRATNDAFLARYEPLGFWPGALAHYYGLAEATVCVTGHRPGRGPLYLGVSGAALEQGRVVDADPSDPDLRWIAGVGWTDAASSVVVVDPQTAAEVGDDRIGEIWASGPSMARGYWNDPDSTAATFGWRVPGSDRSFFRTGDLGFRRGGELYITGRLKELIIVGGRNVYPVDIEATVQDLDPMLVRDRGAAFPVERDGTEAVALVQELRREGDVDVDDLLRRSVRAIADAHEVEVAAVVLIRQGTLPLTSSGKVQRGEARRRMIEGELKEIAAYRRRERPSASEGAASPRAVESGAVVGAIVAAVCEEIAAALDLAADDIDPAEPLTSYGFGSLVAARLAERVGERFGLDVEPTQFYDTPTVEAVAAWISEQGGAERLSAQPKAEADAADAAPAPDEDDAVAIVGMACRLPGAADLESFWAMLLAGDEGVGDPPSDRRELIAQLAASPDVPARAGYIEDCAAFDPAFFRMGKREADLLDPQHRLLLETTWHALEHAGRRPEDLRGAPVGVFVGISTSDYGELLRDQDTASDPHFPTGNAHNMAANRLSYLFDWRGPSFGVDTACSSSLVAAHLAVQSLRRGECALAVVGGVNLILTARLTRAFHAAGMLSADGRCKTFDAAADGYVRGEGCGVLVLKPMAAARRDGDRIIAAIRGSAVNQDGLSNGITAPNGPAQQAVIRAALADARVDAGSVGYVETHGTGTDLGDPIEIGALAEVLSAEEGRPDPVPAPLLGALKSNIGHLEAAAGVAGLIKAALVVSRGEVPPNRNFDTPNPKIARSLDRLSLPVRRQTWDASGRGRVAGVSSFGFGGANAHIVLADVGSIQGQDDREPPETQPAELLCMSAGSQDGLRALAQAWREAFARRPEVTAATWAVAAARHRGQLPWRLAVAGRTVAEFDAALADWLAGRGDALSGKAPKRGPLRVGIAFVPSKGRAAADETAGFRQVAGTVEELGLAGRGGTGPADRLARMLGLSRLLKAWGVRPCAVSGTGPGGWAAAAAAGLISPHEALRGVVDGIAAPPVGGTADDVVAVDGGRDPASALKRGGCDHVIDLDETADPASVLRTIGAAWIAGAGVDPARGVDKRRQPAVDLPLMRFDRRICWYDAPGEEQGWLRSALGALGAAQAPIATLGPALRQLTAIGEVRHAATAPPPAPAAPDVQDTLTELIADLLGRGREEIDVHERFVEMGADSIVLTRALRRIEERFGVKLTVRQLFETTPDIASLAAYLASSAAAGDAAEPTDSAAQPAPSSPVDPLPTAPPSDDLRALLRRTDETMRALIAQQEELRRRIESGPVAASTPPRPVTETATETGTPAASALPLWRPAKDPATTEERTRALDRLIPRYTKMTAGSKRLTAAFRPRLSDNRASAGFRFSTKEMVYPLVGERASGAYLWDVDGNRYVDISMGFGAYLFGHAPDFVETALREEIERGFALGPQARLAGEVSELVCDLTGADRVAFATTGTEAVMTALRLARTVTGRKRIAIFEGAYHGHFDGVLATSGGDGPVPMAPGVTPSMVADVLVLPYGDDAALETLRQHAGDLAAILVEPVQSRRPELQPGDFLRALRRIADAAGSVLIFDEMITGFRIGSGGAQAHFGVRADLATYGKILGGGLPIGAIAGAAPLLDALDGGQWQYGDDSFPAAETTFFAGTYNKHPLVMASARAMLRRIADLGDGLYTDLNDRSARLANRLDRVFADAGAELRIARFGSLFRFSHGDNVDAFLYALRSRGVFVWEGRNCFLSTAHGDAEIDAVVDAVAGALEDAGVGRSGPRPASDAATQVAAFHLSRGQRQLCLLGQLRPEAGRAYHETAALEIPDGLDMHALRTAMAAVAERHPALRTVIDIEAGEQRVLDESIAVPGPTEHSLADGEDERAAMVDAVAALFPADAPPVRLRAIVRPDGSALLLLVAHHVVADGQSLAIVLTDLAAAYASVRAGTRTSLPSGPSFASFLARQAERADLRARNLDAWTRHLGTPPTLDLPLDRPRPAEASHAGAAVRADLPEHLHGAVAAAARRLSLTPVMVYFGAYLLLLHRLSGQGRLIAGLPSDCRVAEEDSSVVGDCAQMLPIASRLAPGDTVAGFLLALRGTMLDAYERQDFDFAELLDVLDLPADRSRTPLISAAFNLDQSDAVPTGFGDGVRVIQPPVVGVKFELWLNLTRIGERLSARLEHARDLFDEATAERWLSLYAEVLSAITEDADRRVADLPGWQRSRSVPVQPGAVDMVPAWIARIAAAAGDRVAAEGSDGTLSYDTLVRRMDGIAGALAMRGVGPEIPVGICMAPGVGMLSALLGVLRAGGCYVPLDPDQPPRRLAAMAAAGGCALIVTDEANAERAAALGPPTVRISALDTEMAAPPSLPAHPDPEQLAYIMHTSGSTGAPKSVGIPHRALTNLLATMATAPGLGEADRLLSVTPLGFDIAALELYLPLVTGARLTILPSEARRDPAAISAAIVESGATAMQATPATWRLLMDSGWRPPAGFKLLCGGEALPAALADRLTGTGAVLWNLYGPTETTIWSMRAAVSDPASITLGDPVGGTAIHLVDGTVDLVPDGAVGEIAIGGVGLARGYGGQPGLTADRFRPDPYSGVPGARLYLTGDLARTGPDGGLVYLGRRDDQTKIRGHRVEIGEIVAAMERLAAVDATAVVIETGSDGGAEPVGFVVPAGGGAPSVEDLRAGLSETLPLYMVPTRFHLVDALPLNANGKVDRAALSSMTGRRAPSETRFAPPAGGTEGAIAEVWGEVLGLTRVGAEDGFFELGGTSLALARVHDRLQQRLGWRFPLALCVSRPTVRALAAALDGEDRSAKQTVAAVAAAEDRARRRRATLETLRRSSDGPKKAEG
ncbi:MAG: amino acid adenylation domain-containing protein [Thalassobaculaceae bacterium]|uniref:amino acid adenylation domain-containing protein n=1 Tax=Roseitalea porphyridii TaxID=1852022 RepID=UPI0032EB9E49